MDLFLFLFDIINIFRAIARTLIGGGGGGCIFIYSCSARQVSFQIKFKLINLKRNLSGKK